MTESGRSPFKQRTVSIIIPVYNDEEHIARAIESALAQTLEEVEVIVVDDGSTDGTSEVLKTYEGQIFHIRQQNRGMAAARNAGIRASCGDYVCFLDSDDTFTPDKVEIQAACLDDDPDVGLSYGGWLDVSIETGEVLRDFSLARPERDPKVDAFPPHFPVFSALIRRRWCDKVGLFDEQLISAADSDFWWRLWAAGCVFRRVKCVVAKRGVRPGSMSHNIPVHHRYEILAYKKHFARMGPRAPRALRGSTLRRKWLEIAGYHLDRKEHALAEEALQSAFRYDRQFLCNFKNLRPVFDQTTPTYAMHSAKRDENYSQAWAELVRTIGRVLQRLPNHGRAELSRQEMSALAHAISEHSEAESRTWVARRWLVKSLFLGRGVPATGAHWRQVSQIFLGPTLTRFTALVLGGLRLFWHRITRHEVS